MYSGSSNFVSMSYKRTVTTIHIEWSLTCGLQGDTELVGGHLPGAVRVERQEQHLEPQHRNMNIWTTTQKHAYLEPQKDEHLEPQHTNMNIGFGFLSTYKLKLKYYFALLWAYRFCVIKLTWIVLLVRCCKCWICSTLIWNC